MPSKSRKSLILTFALLALALPAVVSALNLVAPVSAKPAPPAPCAANEVCFKLTLKAADGKTLNPVPQFTLTTGGCAVSPTIVNGDGQPHVITAGSGCAITLSAPTTNPSTEMFLFRGSTIASPKVTQTIVACGSGNCKSFNFAYYHLFFVSYSYANASAKALPSVPTVHYTQLGRGLTLTAPLAPLGEWTDAGTTSTFKNPLFSAPPPHQHDAKQHDNTNGNDATERWFASPSSCLVAGATTCTATYFDEFKNTYTAYAVLPPSEGGTPIAFEGGVRIPVNGLQGGNPAVVCTINTNDRRGSASCAGWTDSGSPATFGIYGTHGKGELWLAADYQNLVPWAFGSAGNTAKDSYYQLFLLTVKEHFTFSGPWHSTETKPHLSDVTIPQWVVRGSSVNITAISPTQAPCVGSFVCTFTQWIGSGRGSVTTCKTGETCTTCGTGDKDWKPECAVAFSNPITVVVNNPVTETEVFTVTPSTPVGKMSPSISTALSTTTITGGSPVYDTATLSGSTSTAGGTVQYKYYSGSSCSGPVTVVGSPVTVTNGVVPNSDSVTFNPARAYSWIAVYSGDSYNNAATSACESLGITITSTITFPGSSSTASGYLDQNGNAGNSTSQVCNGDNLCFWIAKGSHFDNGSITLRSIPGLTEGEGLPLSTCGGSSTCTLFDISASNFDSTTMTNGVITFCLSPVGLTVTASSYLQFWNSTALPSPGQWVTITYGVPPPICGQLPMSALTGTNLAVITPVTPTSGGGGGGTSSVATTTTSTALTSTTTTTLRTTTSSTTSTTSTSSTSSTTSRTTTSSITTSPTTSTTSTTSPTSTSSTSTGTTSVTTVTTTVPPSTTTMTTTSPLTTQLSSNGVIIASVAGVAVVAVIVGVLAARYVGGGRRRIRGESETGPISKPASTQ